MNITISDEIKTLVPAFSVGVIEAVIETNQTEDLDQLITDLETELNERYDITDVVGLETIKEGRQAYKSFGKDPSRYRLAVESLYRRIVKGNKLYRINDVVDIGNVISIKSRKSVAMLDKDRIKGDIVIRLGKETDEFYGIGRGKLNITNIPLYEDDISPFGSSTSDTDRTKITLNTESLLMFIISFTGQDTLEDEIALTKNLFDKFIPHKEFKSQVL